MKTNGEKWLADQLARHAGGQDAELPAGLSRVSGALQQAMRETQPRPGFVNELAEQIQIQQRAAPRASASALWLWRLLAGAAGALVMVAFTLFVSGLFSRPAVDSPLAGQETRLPPVVLHGEGGLFAGVEFRLREPLPTEPESLALYQAVVAPLPATAEAVRDLARALGVADPAVYRVGEGWLAEDEAGRRLMIDPTSARFPIIYHVQSDPLEVGPVFIPPSAASRAAAFLEAGGLLPAAYEKRERLEAPGFGRMLVEIIPLLDGRPVHYGASEVVVDPDAGVVAARILPLRFTPTGEQATAQSGQEAFESVLQRGGTMDAVTLDPVDLPVKTFYPSLARAAAGDPVRLLGFVRRLEPVDGGPAQIRLTQDPVGEHAILLTGPLAEGVPGRQGELLVEVVGSMEGQAGRGARSLAVSEWLTPPSNGEVLDCRTGLLHREAGELFFLPDEGPAAVYRLTYPPDVSGGNRAEVCALFSRQPLAWLRMTIPPLREQMPAFGAMSGAGLREQVEVVEVTPVIGIVTERVEVAGGSVFTEMVTAPLDSPFEMGQQVEVTGVVGGFLRVEDGRVVPHIYLQVDGDENPATVPLAYPLSGPWEQLMAISRKNHLHVTVRATVVEAQAGDGYLFQGPEGQALVLDDDWWQTWPDEQVEPFRGYYELATLEGREVRLFVDAATGRRYVDVAPLYYARPGDALLSNQPDANNPVWVTGVVNPDPRAAFGGLPILTILKQQGEPSLPDGPEAWMLDAAMPLHTGGPTTEPAALANTLIVDWAALGYTYQAWADGAESQTLQPAWLFYGHSSDERAYFVLRAPALADGTRE